MNKSFVFKSGKLIAPEEGEVELLSQFFESYSDFDECLRIAGYIKEVEFGNDLMDVWMQGIDSSWPIYVALWGEVEVFIASMSDYFEFLNFAKGYLDFARLEISQIRKELSLG